MPELPDITVYVEALRRFIIGKTIEKVRLASPFLVRTVQPQLSDLQGHRVVRVGRLGKRIVFVMENGVVAALHLMIAGRLRWKKRDAALTRRTGLMAWDFEDGTLVLTEASSKKRASLHLFATERDVAGIDAGGLEPLDATRDELVAALTKQNHTIKRALTDPAMVAGIGNAYSDEILHAARLSPARWTKHMTEDQWDRLHAAVQGVLTTWTQRLREQTGAAFPSKVTAFHPEMAVHGKYGHACPGCSDPVQKIVRGEHETNYCATCQTDGKLLADGAMSRLLRSDRPRTLAEMEERYRTARD